jgi:hypothetical protein
MNSVSLLEAKKVIELFPSEEFYIDFNYELWYDEESGTMNDNSISLSEYYRICEKVLNERSGIEP